MTAGSHDGKYYYTIVLGTHYTSFLIVYDYCLLLHVFKQFEVKIFKGEQET